jgi:hypothetical protein
MSSFIGNKPNQVPTNGDLGRLAFMDYLGMEDIGASIPTIVSASNIYPQVKISYVSGTTAIDTITPPQELINGGQITLIPTGIFSLSTAGNIALAINAEISKAIILTYDSVIAKWYPSYTNTVNNLTMNGTANSTITLGTGGTVTYTKDKLSVFAQTSSSEFASVISDGAIGSGKIVLATSPTLTTPTIGAATATSINKVAITAVATNATITIADQKTLTVNNTVTLTGTDASTITFGTGGTVAYTGNKLSVFAPTLSSELAGVISDETGTGSLVFSNSPSLVTPTIGAATATSINKVAITAVATNATITIADQKTLTVNNTVTLTGTDASTITFGTGGTVAYTGNKLSVFAATTSSELAGVISDETGFNTTGLLMFNNNPTVVTGIVADAASTTFNLINTNASTVNSFGAATTLNVGYTGTGVASTTNISTGALAGAFTKTVNLGTAGAAGSTTNINIGSSIAGTTTISSPTIAAGSSTLDLFTTTAATLNFGSAATTLSMGYTGTSASSTTNISTGALTGSFTKTINIGTAGTTGSTTTINIGSTIGGTTTVNYNLDVLQNITAHQNVTAYYSSDKRLKENITPIENPLNKLLTLSGNTFKWSDEHYATQNQEMVKQYDVGVIAQEVLAVLPEAVHERDSGMLAVDYTKLIPLLIECIKAQQVQINELKERGNN